MTAPPSAPPSPDPAPGHAARRALAAALAIALAALAAHARALAGGFVFDDHLLAGSSALLRGPLWRVWATSSATDWWPVTWSAFWIERRAWGASPWGWHATTIALHAVAAILLWRALRRLRVPGAWIAGLLFAVHPATVASVAWISETKNTLSGALCFGALLAFLRAEDGGGRRAYLASIALFAAAALAKVTVVALPVVLLGIALARRGRLSRRDLARAAPFLAVAAAVGAVNVRFQRANAMAGGWAPPRGAAERVGDAARALSVYLGNALLPVRLGFAHDPFPAPGSPGFWLPLAALAGVAAALALARRHPAARAAGLALAYHAVLVLPALGLVDIAFLAVSPVSNHLQYLALAGPAALAGAAVAAVARSAPARALAGAGLAAALGAVTFRRAAAFQDDLALWTAAVREAPRDAFAHVERAAALDERGRAAESADDLLAAARAAPDPANRERYRAVWLLREGDRAGAAGEARAALAASDDPEVRRDAAWVLVQAGDAAEAVPVLRSLVREAPNASDYAYWLGAALARSGDLPGAAAALGAWSAAHPGDRGVARALAAVLTALRARPPPGEATGPTPRAARAATGAPPTRARAPGAPTPRSR